MSGIKTENRPLFRVMLLVAVLSLLAACGSPEPSTSDSTQPPDTTDSSDSSDSSDFPQALQEVIAGAEEEGGTVNARIQEGLTQDMLSQLEDQIEDWSGVRLNLVNLNITEPLAVACSEVQAGVQPSFDLAQDTDKAAIEGLEAECFEQVDWKSLLTDETPEEVVFETDEHGQVAIEQRTISVMWVYNADHVDGSTLGDDWSALGRPEFRGKVGVVPYSSALARGAFYLGEDQFFTDLRAMVENDVVVEGYQTQKDRMTLGELWIGRVTNAQYEDLLDEGFNAEYAPLGYLEQLQQVFVMPKDAAHPNSAKLLAVYLASPDGAKWLSDNMNECLHVYPCTGSDIVEETEAQGMSVIETWSDPDVIEFTNSPQFEEYVGRAQEIMAGN